MENTEIWLILELLVLGCWFYMWKFTNIVFNRYDYLVIIITSMFAIRNIYLLVQ